MWTRCPTNLLHFPCLLQEGPGGQCCELWSLGLMHGLELSAYRTLPLTETFSISPPATS